MVLSAHVCPFPESCTYRHVRTKRLCHNFLIGKGYTYRYTYYNVMSQLYDWNRAHVHAYVLSCYVTTFWLEKGTRTRIRTIMLSHIGKRTYHFGTYYNVMSQLSDWNRAHMCTERTTVCFGRIHGSQLREGANAGQHTPTLSLPPSHHCEVYRGYVRT